MSATPTEDLYTDLASAATIFEDRKLSIVTMAGKDWLKVPNYPHQSADYIAKQTHAAHWKQIQKDAEILQGPLITVTTARLDDRLVKIDGHVRAVLWESGYLPMPVRVVVIVYPVESENELSVIYNTVQNGTRQFYENVITAYEEFGIRVKSNRLKHGFIVEAMNIAIRGATRKFQDKRVYREELDMRDAVAAFKAEIELLDSIDPRSDVFVTGVLAAALLMLAIDPKRIGFFKKLAKGQGNTREGQRDPVEATLRYLDSVGSKRISQGKLQSDICERTVRASLIWEAGESDPAYWGQQTLRGTSLAPFIRELRRIKKVH